MPKELKTYIKDGKTYANINDLHLWKDNPTIILEDSYNDLKAIIKKRGQNLPIIVNSGKVWGTAGDIPNGNTRLKIYREEEITDVWISLVDAQDEFDFIQLSLEHNVRYGATDPDKLAQMLMTYKDNPALEHLKVLMASPADVSSLMKFYGPSEQPTEAQVDEDTTGTKKIDTYMTSSIKQISLQFPAEEYFEVVKQLENLRLEMGVDTNTAVFMNLLEFYNEKNSR